jgi:hypothetical protein
MDYFRIEAHCRTLANLLQASLLFDSSLLTNVGQRLSSTMLIPGHKYSVGQVGQSQSLLRSDLHELLSSSKFSWSIN